MSREQREPEVLRVVLAAFEDVAYGLNHVVLATSGADAECDLRPGCRVEDDTPELGDYDICEWPRAQSAGLWLLEWNYRTVPHPEYADDDDGEFDEVPVTTIKYGASRYVPITDAILREFGLIPEVTQ